MKNPEKPVRRPPPASLDEGMQRLGALADPTQRQLYQYVVGQADPVSREDAASALGIARHIAKFHLDRLARDGLLEIGHRPPPGRGGPCAGRPSKVYLRSQAEVAVSLPQRHDDLAARVFAEAITRSEDALLPVREALHACAHDEGRQMAGELDPMEASAETDPDLTDKVLRVLRTHGYEPRVHGGSIRLMNCPFHRLAGQYKELVCDMTLDVIHGITAALEASSIQVRLKPGEGHCCVRLQDAEPA